MIGLHVGKGKLVETPLLPLLGCNFDYSYQILIISFNGVLHETANYRDFSLWMPNFYLITKAGFFSGLKYCNKASELIFQ